jgi:uncharacterized protein (TIGR03083 family)
MTKDELFTATTKHRNKLLDTLDTLTEAEWNTASLCDGWRVRDVIGHLLSILEIPMGKFVLNAAKAKSFDKYAFQVATEFGGSNPKELAQRFRTAAVTRFAPPIIGPIAPLSDILIHTRDIERPLQRASQLDPTSLQAALAYLCGGKARGFVPPARAKGIRFNATDLGWTSGAGPEVSGPGEAILLAVTGRRVALTDLSGEGVSLLTNRLG